MAETTYIKAITAALATAMRADERVFVLGEDVAEGGPYTATAGLAEEFGTARVINTPISEAAITRRRDRRGAVGHAAGARDHVHRLHHARARPARQRGREGALHVRRPADGAARAAHAGRRGLPRRRAALAEPRELADARAGPEGRDAEPPAATPPGCSRARSPTRTPSSSSRTRRSTSAAARCPTRSPPVPIGEAVTLREGGDVTIVALSRLVARGARGGRPARGRGRHRGRGHRPAHARPARPRRDRRVGASAPAGS